MACREDERQREEEERLKRTVRFNFGVQDMEKYKAKLKADGKELGFLEEGDLEDGELQKFQERAAGWPYMLDMNDPKYAVARYAATLSKPLLMPDGKLHGFDSKTACQSLEALLTDSIVKKEDPKVYTHVDMAGEKGGKFYIATSEEEAERLGRKAWCTEKQFLRVYALATLHGHKTWLIEQHTLLDPLDPSKGNKMVYFMDLDINQPEIIKPQTIEVLVFIIVRALRKFFPAAPPALFQCICATTVSKIDRCQGCLCGPCSSKPSKLCETCKGVGNTGLSSSGHACGACGGTYPVKKKTGLHLHFPRIVVTTAQALDIRQTMIAESKRLWGVRAPPFNDWEDVFDGSVYKKAGLRMLGANKGEICKACKSSKTGKLEDCAACGNRRKIDQGRPYFPLACFGKEGYRDKELETSYEADFCALVQDVSIRATGRDLTEGYVLYEGAPTDLTSIRQGKKRSRSGDVVGVPSAKEHGSSGQGVPMLAQDAPEMAAIQSFFSDKYVQQQVCPEKYGHLVVSQVKMRQTGGIKYKVDVTGANSRYCMNKGDYHGGNRVYFEFQAASKDRPQGVVQRCYCEKTEVRKYGLCSAFVSGPMPIPERIAQVLFPAPAEKTGSSRSHFSGGEGSVLSRLDPRTMSAASRSQSQMILTAGNLLVRELFGPQQNWTTSARFQGMYGRALLQTPMPRKDKDPHPLFRQVRMDNLGSQDKKLMISLGFMEEEPQALELKKLKVTPSVKQLQVKLSKTVRDILSVVLHSDEGKALKVLKTSRDFSLLKDLVL